MLVVKKSAAPQHIGKAEGFTPEVDRVVRTLLVVAL